MERPRKREWYPQRLVLPSGWQGLAFVFFWGIGFGSAVLMAPLGIGLLFGLIGWGAALTSLTTAFRWAIKQRLGICLDATGLIEVKGLGRRQRFLWSQIDDIAVAQGSAVVRAGSRELRFGPEITGWRRLASRLQDAVRGEEEEADEATGELVSPAEVEEWLGLPHGATLDCRPPTSPQATVGLAIAWLLVTLALCGIYLPFFFGIGQTEGAMKVGALLFVTAHAAVFFGVFSGGLLSKLLKQVRQAAGKGIRAYDTGLDVRHLGGWRHYAWAEVSGLELRNGTWYVTAGDEEFDFEPADRNAAPLLRALQAVVRARAEGRALPSMGPIPAGAISLAGPDEGVSVAVTRGLSRSDDS